MRPAATRPVGEVIGRQPWGILVTPSKDPSPWYGAIRGGERVGFGGHSEQGGDRFTEQQQAALLTRGIDVLTAPAITVRRNAHEIYHNFLSLPGVYEFECPVVHRRADGRIRVIAPSGMEKIVEGDGWTAPWKRAWRGRAS